MVWTAWDGSVPRGWGTVSAISTPSPICRASTDAAGEGPRGAGGCKGPVFPHASATIVKLNAKILGIVPP